MENVLHAPAQRRGGNRTATLAACVLAAFALLAVVLAGIALYGQATVTDFTAKNLGPSFEHPFGTDWMGRDMLARVLAGLLLVLISFALGKGFWGVTIGVAVTHWASLARVVRAEVLQCRQSKFVEVARRLGQSPARIALRHMVPYVLPQFVVGLILLFPHAILHEAAITFLGFGLPPEQPAIGVILSESMSYLSTGAWWLAVFPGVALMCTVGLFDLAGQNLRKLIDPHTAQK